MTTYVLLFLIAALVGMAAALQAQFMGQMGQAIGTFESVFITYGIGGGIIAVSALVMRGGNLGAWRGVPPYTFSSGLLGLAIVGGLAYLAPRIGLVATFTVVVTAQFLHCLPPFARSGAGPFAAVHAAILRSPGNLRERTARKSAPLVGRRAGVSSTGSPKTSRRSNGHSDRTTRSASIGIWTTSASSSDVLRVSRPRTERGKSASCRGLPQVCRTPSAST